MEPILLIGGTGLIGPSAVKELDCMGREVICLNRTGKNPSGGCAEILDRNSYDDLKKVFRKYNSFTLIDMIPYTARQAAVLIEALEGRQPQATFVSSIDVYQAYNNLHPQGKFVAKLQAVPLNENSVVREQLSFQGLEYDKLNVEHIYWSYFDACTVLRMPAIYGLPDTSRVEHYFHRIVRQQEIVLNTALADWRFSRSLNTNCAFAVALSMNNANREVFNISEEKHYTELQWCNLIASHLGREALVQLDEKASIPYDMNVAQHWTVDSSKIRSQLGYTEKYSVEEGLKGVLDELNELSGTGP